MTSQCVAELATFETDLYFIQQFILGPLTRIISNLPNNKAQLVAFCSGMASYAYLAFAPSERGGRGDVKNKVFQTAKETGRSITEVAEEVRSLSIAHHYP